MELIKDFDSMKKEIGGKRVVVFGGFSGLGYEDVNQLETTIKNKLNEEIKQYGIENVVVVSGATSDGIGKCYEVAKSLGLETYGIVSEAGKEYGSDKYCDKVFFVPDPKNTWQVMSPTGDSYMVDIAQKNGVLAYYGGGDVAVAEIKEAKNKKIDIEVDISFNPNPIQIEKKKAKNPNIDATPLRTYIENNKKIENVVTKCRTINTQNSLNNKSQL
jgi:hypothetical protein